MKTDKKIENRIEKILEKYTGIIGDTDNPIENLKMDKKYLIKELNTEVQKAREEAVRGFVESISKQGVTVYVEAPKFVEALEKEAKTYLQSLYKGDKR